MDAYTQSQGYKRCRELLEILHGQPDRTAFSQPADAFKTHLQSNAYAAEVLLKRRSIHSFSQPATTGTGAEDDTFRLSCMAETPCSGGAAQTFSAATGRAPTRPANKTQAEALAVARRILNEQRTAQLRRKSDETQPSTRGNHLEKTQEKLQRQIRESLLFTAPVLLDSQEVSGSNLTSSQMAFSRRNSQTFSEGRLPPSLTHTVHSASNPGPFLAVSTNDARHPVFPLVNLYPSELLSKLVNRFALQAILTRPISSVNDTGDRETMRSLVSYHLGGKISSRLLPLQQSIRIGSRS
uniref:Uncharacterized protein n=1 Tax=Toxoplasma gondii (strain ATCC 50861 / VEG) TaxID=432359 RepID=A0A0F7UY19_TOXGV|nr:TPA: hypothetical protein BN1205_023450 [Toxoplasma gondii VEG]